MDPENLHYTSFCVEINEDQIMIYNKHFDRRNFYQILKKLEPLRNKYDLTFKDLCDLILDLEILHLKNEIFNTLGLNEELRKAILKEIFHTYCSFCYNEKKFPTGELRCKCTH